MGAEVLPGGGVHFRVWAPRHARVDVVLETDDAGRPSPASVIALEAEGGGYFSGVAESARAGVLYRYRLGGGDAFSDPASRYQPEGPHGPSQVVDPGRYRWTDASWRGVGAHGQVLYEMHVGTFTTEGTWAAAERELAELASLGVTVIEMMPVAEFPGRFGWGYDGVDPFAPAHIYGAPDDLRRFVDRAHAVGLGVILDVVYNHMGPDGCYLSEFAGEYFTDRYSTDWGKALNFDGPGSGPVREFFVANAGYWVDEFHFDGLRIDATQNVYDSSTDHVLAELTRRVREAARGRATLVVGENEPQHARLVRAPERGGYDIDALWNDDFHHTAMVALTGRNEAYYSDYLGTPQELISAARWGYLYQGQHYRWQKQRRGTPALDLPPTAFVAFIQNHDQVANSAHGRRVHELTSPGRLRAVTAVMLLGPATPMLFQGQEFASSSPFLYFADQKPELAPLVRDGRREFLAQFPSYARPEVQERLDDPGDPRTFERCKLDFAERERHAPLYALHRDLLALRRGDPVFGARRQGPAARSVDGAVLGAAAFLLRFFGADGGDRLLLVNLGRDLHLDPAPEPLLVPPDGARWDVLWSSEDPRYGGTGTPAVEGDANWHLPGEAAVALRPVARAARGAGARAGASRPDQARDRQDTRRHG